MLTRDQMLSLNDISTKEITIPDTIPAWGGQTVFIKQLTRAKQDEYLRRQFGSTKMKSGNRKTGQEIAAMNLFGHDAWLCVQAVCDEEGTNLFKPGDENTLSTKNGEAIGWIAKQILEFSGMTEDKEVLEGNKTAEEVAADDLKN